MTIMQPHYVSNIDTCENDKTESYMYNNIHNILLLLFVKISYLTKYRETVRCLIFFFKRS